MIFSQNLFRRPTPTSLPVEFLFEILCVGAIPNLHIKLTFRQLLCWALTRIEKACYKRIFVQSTTANITS